MVTDAKWVDMDNNGYDDLIITGHWMGIMIFKNEKGKFTPDKSLEKYKGLWNCIEVADVNNDSNLDIIAGNLGLNTKLKANFIEPIKLYVKDFDENGTQESILSVFKSDHKSYVFHQRRDLADQMPTFKKEYLRYEDYAGKEFSDVFSPSVTNGAQVHEVIILETAVFINNGNNQFECKPLPFPAQVSSVNTILYDKTQGQVILAGNFTDFKPEIGMLEGTFGQVFDFRNGQFVYSSASNKGLKIKGQVRSSLVLTQKKGIAYLFGRNNGRLAVYRRK